MKKFLLTLLLCLTLGTASAWAEEQVEFEFTIQPSDINSDNKTSGYASTWNLTKNNYSWKFVNFHNNGSNTTNNWTYVRAIAKKATIAGVQTATIATQTAASEAISLITINMCRKQTATFNALTLEIADNANFTNATKIDQQVPTTEWQGTTAFDYSLSIPEPKAGMFYRLSFSLTSTSTSNGALQVNSIKYLYDDTPAGPVEPGTVLVNGEAVSEKELELLDGETITFTSEKAAKLGYKIEYDNTPITGTNEGGSTYTHTVDFSKGNSYTITVTPYDSEGTAFTDKEVLVMVSKKLVKPETVLVNGEAAKESYEVAQGEEITFTSANATKLEYEIGDIDIDEIEGTTYTHTADFTNAADGYIVTVTPYDNYGTAYEDLAAAIMIFRKAAELCGEIIYTPADGIVAAGKAVTIACENATEIKYTIDGGEELTYDAATGIVIEAACTIVAWGVNGDGVKGAEKELNVTIKEADKYVLINRVSDIKPGAKYILYGYNNTKKTGDLMGVFNSTYCNAISYGDRTDIITVAESDYEGLNVFTLDEAATAGSYTIKLADNKYLGTTNNNSTTSGKLTTSTSNTGAEYNWVISFNNDAAVIKCGTQQLYYNASDPRFKTYYSTQSPVYLYRLIDDEYYTDEAPAELHIHGSHYSGSWTASSQFEQKVAGEFFFNGFLAYEEDGSIPALVFSTAAFPKPVDTETTGIRPRKAPAASYWSDLEGDVFMPETDGATVGTHNLVRVSTADLAAGKATLNTFAGEHNTSYDLTVDFNGYSPVATLAVHDENNVPTGVENLDATETAEVEYYNLSGLRVANPENGIYIRRQGNKVTKVLMK